MKIIVVSLALLVALPTFSVGHPSTGRDRSVKAGETVVCHDGNLGPCHNGPGVFPVGGRALMFSSSRSSSAIVVPTSSDVATETPAVTEDCATSLAESITFTTSATAVVFSSLTIPASTCSNVVGSATSAGEYTTSSIEDISSTSSSEMVSVPSSKSTTGAEDCTVSTATKSLSSTTSSISVVTSSIISSTGTNDAIMGSSTVEDSTSTTTVSRTSYSTTYETITIATGTTTESSIIDLPNPTTTFSTSLETTTTITVGSTTTQSYILNPSYNPTNTPIVVEVDSCTLSTVYITVTASPSQASKSQNSAVTLTEIGMFGSHMPAYTSDFTSTGPIVTANTSIYTASGTATVPASVSVTVSIASTTKSIAPTISAGAAVKVNNSFVAVLLVVLVVLNCI